MDLSCDLHLISFISSSENEECLLNLLVGKYIPVGVWVGHQLESLYIVYIVD